MVKTSSGTRLVVTSLTAPKHTLRSSDSAMNSQVYRQQIKSWFSEMVKEQEEQANTLVANKGTQTEQQQQPKSCCVIQ